MTITVNRIKGVRPKRRPVLAQPHAVNGHATTAPPLEAVGDGPAPAPRGGKDAATGRFTAGNQFGRGNPHARRQAAFHQALMDAVTPDGFQSLAASLLAAAQGGDVTAAALLLSYLIGKPRSAPDADRLDLEEFMLAASGPSLAEVIRAVADGVHPAAAAATVRSSLDSAAGVHVAQQQLSCEQAGAVLAVLDKVSAGMEEADCEPNGATSLQIGELRKSRCKRAK